MMDKETYKQEYLGNFDANINPLFDGELSVRKSKVYGRHSAYDFVILHNGSSIGEGDTAQDAKNMICAIKDNAALRARIAALEATENRLTCPWCDKKYLEGVASAGDIVKRLKDRITALEAVIKGVPREFWEYDDSVKFIDFLRCKVVVADLLKKHGVTL